MKVPRRFSHLSCAASFPCGTNQLADRICFLPLTGRDGTALRLGSAPQQFQEPALLLQRRREDLTLGAADGHRHGEAQEVHGRQPQRNLGRRPRRQARRQDPRSPPARQAPRLAPPRLVARE